MLLSMYCGCPACVVVIGMRTCNGLVVVFNTDASELALPRETSFVLYQ